MSTNIPESEVRAPRHLKSILKCWVEVCKQFEVETSGDIPWHYHERAHIGFLAAAVWKSGGVAIEEWRTTKSRNRVPSNGRCDLWAKFGGRSYYIEAKHAWIRLRPNPKSAAAKTRIRLAHALRDACANHCNRNRREHRLAVLFAVPSVSTAKRPGNHCQDAKATAEDRFASWLKEIERIPCLAYAVIHDRDFDNRETRTLLPGIVVMIQDADQQGDKGE